MGNTTDGIERSLEMLFRLNASRKVHTRRAAAAGVVVSPPGAVLLRRIQEDGPLSLGDLSRRTEMDPAATSRQIRQLEHDGLVVRRPSAADGRVTVVRVTPRGAAVRRRLAEVAQAHMDGVLEQWSKADRAALARLLARLVDDLRASHYQSIDEERAG
ncbi:MAG: MarR family transcriptional regulator [Acidimicrobiales bacterium]|nr:MarR family transcriptional regulator [Acidimicrobiales bacterium]